MKAIRLISASPLSLIEQEMPRPDPQPGEILVRVHAVAVTPTELVWYPTLHNQDGSPRQGAVLGHEFSGEVAACGDGVTGFAIGQAAYGMNDWFAEGALAEYCITRPDWIVAKPPQLSHEEAASLPISALTAWQGLFERGKLQPGERVLIHGGAGAVGMLAVQLAHQHGARVITTVSAGDVDYVKSLGADEALDYRGAPFEDHVSGVDLVFDTVGGKTLERSWQVLKPGGRLVTVGADSESGTGRVKEAFFIVEPNRMQLDAISKLVAEGDLQPPAGTVVSPSEAADAYAGHSPRSRRGKIVVSTCQWFEKRARE